MVEFLNSPKKNDDYVIDGAHTVNSVSRQFRIAARKIGLENFTFHNLRDTYASWLVQSGVSLVVVRDLLGHEDIKTTLIYAHLAPNNHIEAVRNIDRLLKPCFLIADILPLTKKGLQ